jgi:hypothetical protein
MLSKHHSNQLPVGYAWLRDADVYIPAHVAQSISAEHDAATDIWLALQAGIEPDGSYLSVASNETDETPALVESTSEPAETGALLELNTIQIQRIESLFTRFHKRTKKGFYSGAQIQVDEDLHIPTLDLQRNMDSASIVNSSKSGSEASSKRFGARDSALSKRKSEHSALDMFKSACEKVPGFRLASGRATHAAPQRTNVHAPVAPISYDGSEPPLKFDPPLLGKSEILPSELNNSLVLGSTGSGKTASFLGPVLQAMLEYKIENKSAALLVIDPKVELLAMIEKKLTEIGELDRLVVIGRCPPVQFFQNNDDLSLEDRFAIANKFISIQNERSEDGRWAEMANRLIVSFLRDSERFAMAVGVGLLESMAAIVTDDLQFYERNEWVALRKILILGMEGAAQIAYLSDLYDTLCLGIGLTNLDRPLARYASIKDEDQYFYNARGALILVDLLGGEDLEPIIDLSIRRFASQKVVCNISEHIERGAVIVFQPRPKATHDLAGAALKSLFFRCTMQRQDMTRPVGLVYDEAQRFVTVDSETGEHAFFDRCRAYRVNALMATQSMAALQAAVGLTASASGALESILVNTPTKVCFRTNDNAALQIMKGFIPADPSGMGHVLHARPPSSLKVGESYFSFGHEWGRNRYPLKSDETKGHSDIQSESMKEAT